MVIILSDESWRVGNRPTDAEVRDGSYIINRIQSSSSSTVDRTGRCIDMASDVARSGRQEVGLGSFHISSSQWRSSGTA